MKKLLLIRHAEAEAYSDKGDFARPLSAKGKMDVIQLAEKLKNNAIHPELLISSTAIRTTTTAEIIVQQLQLSQPQFSAAIYEATEKTLLTTINHFSNATDFIAMVGHNPGIAYLLLNLTGKVRDVPPCTAIMVVFEDADSWQEVSHESGVITYYTSPRFTN